MKVKSNSVEVISIDLLKPHPQNMHNHSDEQIDRLCKLIEYQGFRIPLTVQKDTNLIVAGHGRLLAAKKLGAEKVPVIYQEFESSEQLYAFMVSDNAIGKDTWATLDFSQINNDITALGPDFDIDMLGLKDFEIEVADKLEPGSDEDDIPEVVNPISCKNDLWILGKHRLLCGDSTMIDDVERLLNGQEPDFIHTDPPHGMSAVTKSRVLAMKDKTDIPGDDSTDVAKDCFQLIQGLYPKAKQIWWGANYYSSVLPDSENWIVWNKKNGGNDQTDAELAWGNFRSVVRMFTKRSSARNRVHPAQKPVELIDWFIGNKRFKHEPKLIADFFGGSGSTLISAEKNNIPCVIMEFDEKFCDVIIKRWQEYTGNKAKLESNGQTYDEVKENRDGDAEKRS